MIQQFCDHDDEPSGSVKSVNFLAS